MVKNKATKRKNSNKKPYSSISYTTGDIGLNIGRFNQAMGSSTACTSAENCGGLTEAKRYVRRYYIRPQNIFCSNKAEILKALIELDNANCSVYTLNNLGDEKDVSKLMNSDIIYYYDDGILYDKNRVKVMDYDLSIKKEEDRRQFANVEKASEKEFKDAYEDRMTDVTELEEDTDAAILTNAFDLDFDDVNVYGERLTETGTLLCAKCKEPIEGYGHNPDPLPYEGRLCDACNSMFVIPARIAEFNRQKRSD
jgi:hypothetical protein